MTTTMRSSSIRLSAICGLVPLVCVPLAEWMAVARHGSEFFLWFSMLLVFPALVLVPAFIVALVCFPFSKVRQQAGAVMMYSAIYLLAFILALRIGGSIRMSAFHRLAERSKPLISAVRSFEQKHGRPPESLGALVPEFIPSVPSTGMGAYPKYEYVTPATNHHGNPWMITVFTPSGGINFDQFIYLPLTNYPQQGYGGTLERVGDWAYVHE
jgi:hypothetical protein